MSFDVAGHAESTTTTERARRLLRECALDVEIARERDAAHEKHRGSSMRAMSIFADARHSVLSEEVGEVARVLNDFRHLPDDAELLEAQNLRHELVQVAAMASDWVLSIDEWSRKTARRER